MLTFKIEGLEELQADWNVVIDELGKHIAKAVADGCLRGVRAGTDAAGYESGELRRSASGKLLRDTRLWATGEMAWRVPYATYHDEGTRPHPIVARNAPELVFPWKGRIFRGKRVNHPGTKAVHFAEKAMMLCASVAMSHILQGASAAYAVLAKRW